MRKDVLAKIQRFYKERNDFYNSLKDEGIKKALENAEILKLKNRINEIKCLALHGQLTDEINSEYDNIVEEYNSKVAKYLPNIHYECQLCKDTGVVNNKYCSCFINRYMQEIKNMSNKTSLPNFKFSDSCLEKFNLSEENITIYNKLYDAMQLYCKKYPDVMHSNISITGNVGCGKTCLVSAIANALIEKSTSVLFFTSFELSELMRNAHIDYKDNSLTMVTDVDVLIIDDLGSEPMRNNINITYLQAILDSRINHGKSTYFTTNFTALQLMNKYGERVISRLLNDSVSIDMRGLPNLRTIEKLKK